MATEQTLDQRYQAIRNKYLSYTEHTPLNTDHDFVKAGLIWGEDQGNQTPSVLLIALEPGHWDYSREDKLDQRHALGGRSAVHPTDPQLRKVGKRSNLPLVDADLYQAHG